MDDIGVYTIEITVVQDDTDDGTQVEISSTTSFTFEIQDACESTLFSALSIPDLSTIITESVTFEIPTLTDSASLTVGTALDGVSLCGPRLYSISPQQSFLTLSD